MSYNNLCLHFGASLALVLFGIAVSWSCFFLSWSCWLVSGPCLGLGDDVLALVSVLRGDVLALS